MRAPPGDDEFSPRSDVDDSDEETAGDAKDGREVLPERSESVYY